MAIPEDEYKIVISTRTQQSSGPPAVNEVGEVTATGSISYSDEINGEGECSFSVEPETMSQDVADVVKDLRTTPCEVTIFRGTATQWRGPLLSAQLQGPTLTLNGRGLLYYLRYMTLEADLIYASATDQYTIGAGLVDAYQDLAYGNYGIDLSAVGTAGVTRVRRYPYRENQNVFDRLIELAEVDNGFDVWVRHDNRQLKFAATKGTDRTATVFADEANILNPNVFWSVSHDDVASEAIVTGVDDEGNPGVVGVKSNTAVRTTWGRATIFGTAEDVTNQATIDDHAQRLIDQRAEQIIVPGPSVMVIEDVEPSSFETGDLITYSYKAGKLGIMTVQRRVRMRRVTVDEEGVEDMELELI